MHENYLRAGGDFIETDTTRRDLHPSTRSPESANLIYELAQRPSKRPRPVVLHSSANSLNSQADAPQSINPLLRSLEPAPISFQPKTTLDSLQVPSAQPRKP